MCVCLASLPGGPPKQSSYVWNIIGCRCLVWLHHRHRHHLHRPPHPRLHQIRSYSVCSQRIRTPKYLTIFNYHVNPHTDSGVIYDRLGSNDNVDFGNDQNSASELVNNQACHSKIRTWFKK